MAIAIALLAGGITVAAVIVGVLVWRLIEERNALRREVAMLRGELNRGE